MRARIVLTCAGADVPPIVVVARELQIAADTVRKWRRRFSAARLDGLVDEPRPGRPPSISMDRVEAVVVRTLEEIPKNATHWSRATMADRSGLSKSTVGRIWRRFQLKPHLSNTFKLSTDPLSPSNLMCVCVAGACWSSPEKEAAVGTLTKSPCRIRTIDH
ncbi:helix-turn-helix domain-containing protein [Streptomyces sp. NPDC050264]|uniref:helix-turn-helix domain-containing protein n=1 Tax=Streptomyces sp. NPDC050264 TaxID=3155038 RepID=UPI0034433DAA